MRKRTKELSPIDRMFAATSATARPKVSVVSQFELAADPMAKPAPFHVCLAQSMERLMRIQRDGKGQPFIEWQQMPGVFKRAWVQRKDAEDKDWAKTGRYLNVVRCNASGNPGGNATDFPIFHSPLSDEQLLRAFVQSVCAMTGCSLPDEV